MQPPLPVLRTIVTRTAVQVPISDTSEISPNNKEAQFKALEERFLKDRTDSHYISLLSLLMYAGEYDRMKKALDDYSSGFKGTSMVFNAFYLFHHNKILECATVLAGFLKLNRATSEGIFLAATLQSSMSVPIPFENNYGIHALTHYLRGNYELALQTCEKIPADYKLDWIALLIQVTQFGFNQERIDLMCRINIPRCALLGLLVAGKKCVELENLAEAKLELFSYDFPLRDAVMTYYTKVGMMNEAFYHYEQYDRGAPNHSDRFFVKARFNIRIGRFEEAAKIMDQHVPLTHDCYVNRARLYKQMPDCADRLKTCLKEGIKLFPKSLTLLHEMLEVEEEEGEYTETIDRVLKINPNDKGALLRKAAIAEDFKTAKKYLAKLEEHYPDDEATLNIGIAVRYEFGQELNRALRDVQILRSRKIDLINTKFYVDLLIQLEKYNEVLELAAEKNEEFSSLLHFRVVICLLRINLADKASVLLEIYETKSCLNDFELVIKGELLVARGQYVEAYPCFKNIKPRSIHTHYKSVRAYFKCLKELNKGEEARDFYERLPESERGFYGEYVTWIQTLPRPVKAAPARRAAATAVDSFVSTCLPVKKKREDELVKPSENSISLLKGAFSSAKTEGVDPLFRKKPKDIADEIARRSLIVPYPAEFVDCLDRATDSLHSLRGCLLRQTFCAREAGYHLMNFLTLLHRHPDAVSIISSRVINFESLRHSLILIRRYPHLMAPQTTRSFAQECLRLERALQDSKTKYANVADFNVSPIKESEGFEKSQNKALILLNFILDELHFITNSQYNFFDFDEERETKILVQAAWNIRTAIGAMRNYDMDKAEVLRKLFFEFSSPFRQLCINQPELDGVNFEMVTFIFFNATQKILEIKKLT